MKSKLTRIASAVLPVLMLGAAAANASDDRLAGFVGKPVYDEGGVFFGSIREVVVDYPGNSTEVVAFVERPNGDTVSVPLGDTEALLATITPPPVVAFAEVSPTLIVPEYITPESRGS